MRPLKSLELPLSGNFLIEASAGTGKTYAISNLYLRLLLERELSVEQILVVTFTNAATEELRGRIRQRIRHTLQAFNGAATEDEFVLALLSRWDDRSRAIDLLSLALINMDQASIFTIHTFCQRMLRENAFESGAWFEIELMNGDNEFLIAIIEDFWRREFYPASSGLAKLVYNHWQTPADLLATIRSFLARHQLHILPEIDPEEVSESRYRTLMQKIKLVWREQEIEIRELLYEDKALSRRKGGYKHDHLDTIISTWKEFLHNEIQDYDLPYGFQLFTRDQLDSQLKKKGTQAPSHRFFDLCQNVHGLCENTIIQILTQAIEYCREELKQRKQVKRVLSFDDLVSNLHQALFSDAGKNLAQHICRQFPAALIDEFQDTDPAQYEIFQQIYSGRDNNGLFLIGDPKQAIYGFRGGDIFTYMQASRELSGSANIFSLDHNWRSSSRLVDAVNLLFDSAKAPFIFEGEIDFYPVKAAVKADQTPLTVAGKVPKPMQIWFVEKTDQNQHQGKIKKTWARQTIADACAVEISSLLKGSTFIGEHKLQAKDIAILVRDRYEARTIQQSLLSEGIVSAFISRDSVIETEETEQLHRILLAVADPSNESLVRGALATELIGISGNQLDQLLGDEIAWEQRLQQFRDFHHLWCTRSFIVMFQTLIHQLKIPEKVMSLTDGERRITNLLQLGELLQIASQEQPAIEALLRWFDQQRQDPDRNNEDQQLRLESDEDLVKVVTIYKSKGLEYPVVFIPYLWASKKTNRIPPFLFHNQTDSTLCLELGSSQQKQHEELMLRERLAEELRLLYVALTRAKYLCWFAWGNINSAAESALSYLLCQPKGMQDPMREIPAVMKLLTDAELRERLEALSQNSSGSIKVSPLPLFDQPIRLKTMDPREKSEHGEQLEVRQFTGQINTDWRMTSYSALASGAESLMSFPDHDAVDQESEHKQLTTEQQISEVFQFPRGARAGTFLHELMEVLDFPTATGETLTEKVAQLLKKHGFERNRWQAAIETLVTNVLDTDLDKDNGISLRKLTDKQKLVELKFYFPVEMLDSNRLEKILRKHYRYPPDAPVLVFDQIQGMMQGFIDLVFEYGGRYFVLDYKSNYLGDTLDFYHRAKLWPAMLIHRYDLQYLIYSVALHRYLRNRIPQYEYARHFGGVYYLFMRGMEINQGPNSGVFFDLPDYRLIAELDAMFSGDRTHNDG